MKQLPLQCFYRVQAHCVLAVWIPCILSIKCARLVLHPRELIRQRNRSSNGFIPVLNNQKKAVLKRSSGAGLKWKMKRCLKELRFLHGPGRYFRVCVWKSGQAHFQKPSLSIFFRHGFPGVFGKDGVRNIQNMSGDASAFPAGLPEPACWQIPAAEEYGFCMDPPAPILG